MHNLNVRLRITTPVSSYSCMHHHAVVVITHHTKELTLMHKAATAGNKIAMRTAVLLLLHHVSH